MSYKRTFSESEATMLEGVQISCDSLPWFGLPFEILWKKITPIKLWSGKINMAWMPNYVLFTSKCQQGISLFVTFMARDWAQFTFISKKLHLYSCIKFKTLFLFYSHKNNFNSRKQTLVFTPNIKQQCFGIQKLRFTIIHLISN